VLTRKATPSNLVWYESPLLAAAGVPHAFSTRLGGVSPAPFDSLNLGNPNGCPIQDSTERIGENYRLLQTEIGAADRRLLKVHQVHGREIAVAGEQPWNPDCKADAIIVTDPNHLASVRVADCVPVLLATAEGTAVAAVHAGWRGVIAGVVTHAIEQLRRIRPGAHLLAAIGPCIGMDAFEVGPEVLDVFAANFGAAAPIRRRADGKGHVDLRQAIALQLHAAGLAANQIDTTDRCTFRDKQEFFSHRRDNGVTGRMSAMIGIQAPPC
jgi:YfiH family protein